MRHQVPRRSHVPLLIAFIAVALALAVAQTGGRAAAPITRFRTRRSVYKFPSEFDQRVLADEETELWAEVTRPNRVRSQPYPLVLFLHGNHGTCGRDNPRRGIREDFGSQYTFEGRCTGRSNVVVPNHEGYRYVADPLARGGVIVVSINANRGITSNSGGADDSGLNLARGRLILKHLEQLAKWNSGEEDTPARLGRSLEGQIDFSNVGIMGHSRGGEGARAALQLYRDADSIWPAAIGEDVNIKALFEIAPVDGQTSRQLNVQGVASAIVLPSCDGDVSNLAGMKVFDRVFRRGRPDRVERSKATFLVVGANHNAFNTEWQESDTQACADGTPEIFRSTGESKDQQFIITRTLIPFFRAALFGEVSKGRVFDPGFPIPQGLSNITFYERGHLRAPPASSNGVEIIQTFSGPSGVSDAGFDNSMGGLTVLHRDNFLSEHESGQLTARLDWRTRGEHFYTINLNGEDGMDLSDVKTISFRVALGCSGGICNQVIDEKRDVDIRVSLQDTDMNMSPQVRFSSFVVIRRPTSDDFSSPHDVLQTVDIPVNAFGRGSGFQVGKITGIRFDIVDLDDISRGQVFLGQITTDRIFFKGQTFEVDRRSLIEPVTSERKAVSSLKTYSTRVATRRGSEPMTTISAERSGNRISLLLSSSVMFPITNSMPILEIGNFKTVDGGMVVKEGVMRFTLSEADFLGLVTGSAVNVRVGMRVWGYEAMPEPSTLL